MPRIAAVQHGDWLEAQRVISSGKREPYFGMGYTLRVLGELFAGSPHLVVSLDAPETREVVGDGVYVGVPCRHVLVGSLSELLWARRVRAELEAFRPTHILLRAGGFVAIAVLEYARAHGVSTLVVFAGAFDAGSFVTRQVTRRLVALLREPGVFLVGNHKAPATQSMIAFGVPAERAIAWDWPNARHPRDHAPRTLAGDPWRLGYVGSISEPKGVGDLLEAVRILREEGHPARLELAGDGPAVEALKERARALPEGAIRFLGRLGNDEVFRLMTECAVMCVPSRHEFSEGMPLTLTEALAARTPVVISDHPVFAAFRDGEGVRVFPAKDARALARAIDAVVRDPVEYARLSTGTLEAYRRVECTTYFGDLIERWKATIDGPWRRAADLGGEGGRVPAP